MLIKATNFCRLLTVMVCLIVSSAAFALHGADHQNDLKAAILYKFAKFVAWPAEVLAAESDEDESVAIQFCFLDDEAVSSAFQSIPNKTIKKRAVIVRDDVFVASMLEQGCHVIFMGELAEDQISEALDQIDGMPILSVSSASGFVQLGGILQLRLVDTKLRFDINLTEAKAVNLQVSSDLLKLATTVVK